MLSQMFQPGAGWNPPAGSVTSFEAPEPHFAGRKKLFMRGPADELLQRIRRFGKMVDFREAGDEASHHRIYERSQHPRYVYLRKVERESHELSL